MGRCKLPHYKEKMNMQNLKSFKIYLLTAFLVGTLSLTMGQNTADVEGTTENDTIVTPAVPVAIRPPVEGVFNTPGGKNTHLHQKSPMPLTPIRVADGMWTKTVYQFIDVRERINQVLYYPTEAKGDRISLLMTMWYASRFDTNLVNTRNRSMSNLYGQEITIEEPLRAYTDEYVNVPFAYEEMLQQFGYQRTDVINELDEYGAPTGVQTKVKKTEIYSTQDLIGFEIKEVWIFDKQRSVIDNSHILAIRPIFEYEREEDASAGIIGGGDEDFEEEGPTEIGRGPWFYFPELRYFTANANVYNEKNSAESRSFDEIFIKRRFSGVIKGVANEKNDRKFKEYIMYGLDQVLASDQIKDEIRKLEHDLWEF